MSAMLRMRIVKSCVAAALLGLTACAVVDQYSDRAIVYNLQAEQAQQQALLLNVVRASLRRPMQFTGLQTITGTASASGSINGAGGITQQIPYISLFNLIPPSSSGLVSRTNTGSIGATGTMSGGPTFSVPVLDTAEFYNGFLRPLPGQTVDLYLQNGYPRDVLFNLVIERIIIKRSDGECREERHTRECELTIRNYAPEDVSLYLFQGIVGHLIHLGLSTEPIVEVAEKGGKGSGDDKGKGSSDSNATRQTPPFGFCFAPQDPKVYRDLNPRVLCGHPAAPVELRKSTIGRKSVISGVHLSREFVHDLYERAIAPRLGTDVRASGFKSFTAFADKKVSVSFNTRSIEGILYYLGEIVRRSSHPEGGQSTDPVQVRVGPPQNPFPDEICPFRNADVEGHRDGYRCTNLFVVDEGVTHPGGITTTYQGITYSISADAGSSWTLPVFDVVKQLQAINTSAKELPASNLISVISNQ